MAKKCKNCGLLNLDSAAECVSCGSTEFEPAGHVQTHVETLETQETQETQPKKLPPKSDSDTKSEPEAPKKKRRKLILGIIAVTLISLAGNAFSIWFAVTNLDKLSSSSVNPSPGFNTTESDPGASSNNPEKPDRTAPVIKFAEQTVKVVTGSTFCEGDNVESVIDDCDGTLNEFAKKPQSDAAYYICVSKKVDTSKPGEYTVTYNAYDLAGNKSEKSYEVIVADEFYDSGYITSLNGLTQTEKDRIKGYADNSVRAKVANGYKIDQNTIKYEGLMLITLKDAYADSESLVHNKYMVVYSATSKANTAGHQVYYVVTYTNVTAKDDGTSTVVESESSIEDFSFSGSLSEVVRDCVTSQSDKYNYDLGDGMEAYDSPKVN